MYSVPIKEILKVPCNRPVTRNKGIKEHIDEKYVSDENMFSKIMKETKRRLQ